MTEQKITGLKDTFPVVMGFCTNCGAVGVYYPASKEYFHSRTMKQECEEEKKIIRKILEAEK